MKPFLSIIQNVFILTAISFSIGCSSDDHQEELPLNDELSLMTTEERQQRAPNAAFEAVFLRDTEALQQVLDSDLYLFSTQNSDGLTPGMLAIKMREEGLATLIISSLNLDTLKDKDINGRGYMSYAAEEGYISLIELIGEKYKDSQAWGLSRFHNIDFDDELGRHSLFYAANGLVAGRLKDYWMQWMVTWAFSSTWMSGFYQKHDNEDKNFLHLAALDNRHDTLLWAIQETCGDALWEDSEYLFGFLSRLGSVLDWLGSTSQLIPLIPDDLVNQRDFQDNTPLHLAAQKSNFEAGRVLMSCRNTRYTPQNALGRTPLAELVANLDPQQASIARNSRDFFEALVQMENRYIRWWANLQDIINTQDFEGKSALHHAANLRDPSFYNFLKEYGDIYLTDDLGRTPESIFLARQREL